MLYFCSNVETVTDNLWQSGIPPSFTSLSHMFYILQSSLKRNLICIQLINLRKPLGIANEEYEMCKFTSKKFLSESKLFENIQSVPIC